MPTASYLIADMQVKLGDPSGNIYTSANLLNWLNEAQKNFALNTMPIRIVDATVADRNNYRFALPSDCIMIEAIVSMAKFPSHDTVSPVADMAFPPNGAVLSASQTLVTVSAIDNVAVDYVEFRIGLGSTVAIASAPGPYSYLWDLRGLSGAQTISALTYDTSGNIRIVGAVVTVV
jgi:hypothetical protein